MGAGEQPDHGGCERVAAQLAGGGRGWGLAGLATLGARLHVIPLEAMPLEVIQRATDSLDQLIVGQLVLTRISEELRQLIPKVLGRVSAAASQAFPNAPRVVPVSSAGEEEDEVMGARPQLRQVLRTR